MRDATAGKPGFPGVVCLLKEMPIIMRQVAVTSASMIEAGNTGDGSQTAEGMDLQTGMFTGQRRD